MSSHPAKLVVRPDTDPLVKGVACIRDLTVAVTEAGADPCVFLKDLRYLSAEELLAKLAANRISFVYTPPEDLPEKG